jgi:hypothetical protein
MSEMDSTPLEGREVLRRRGGRTYNDSSSGETADSVVLTRSGTGLETGGGSRLPDRRQDKGEKSTRPESLHERIRNQKVAREAALKASILQTQVLSTQVQLKNAQKALDAQKAAGIQDAARMAVRVSLLEEELAVVAMHAITDRGILSKERNQWRGAAYGVTALSILCLVWWRVTLPPAPNIADAGGLVSQSASESQAGSRSGFQKDLAALRSAWRKNNPLPAEPHAALATGLNRLNDALAVVPGPRQYEALRKVSANGQACAMVWTDNLPSLLFGGNGQTGVRAAVQQSELANTLADCAAALSLMYPAGQPAESELNSGQSWTPGFRKRLLR